MSSPYSTHDCCITTHRAGSNGARVVPRLVADLIPEVTGPVPLALGLWHSTDTGCRPHKIEGTGEMAATAEEA